MELSLRFSNRIVTRESKTRNHVHFLSCAVKPTRKSTEEQTNVHAHATSMRASNHPHIQTSLLLLLRYKNNANVYFSDMQTVAFNN